MSASALLSVFSVASTAAAAMLLLKVTTVFGAAWLLALLLRRRAAAVRHEVWMAALVAALAVGLLSPLAPSLEMALIPARLAWLAPPVEPDDTWTKATAATAASAETARAARAARAAQRAGGVGVPIAHAEATTPSSTAPTTTAHISHDETTPDTARAPGGFGSASDDARGTPPAPLSLLAALWAAGIAAVLLTCIAGHLGLRRLARRATSLTDPEWSRLLAAGCAGAGVRRAVRLRSSAAVATPVTWGAWRPIVVLPAGAGSWPLERREAALLHELAHVARNDYLAQLAGTVACALYWFHPAAWMALRRLRQESERACDDRVLASGTPPTEYAAQLLEVARGAGALRLAAAAVAIGMARPSTLEGRLLAVLDDSVPRRTVPSRLRLAGAMAVALLLVPFAGLTPVARGAVASAPALRVAPVSREIRAAGSPALAAVSALSPFVSALHGRDDDDSGSSTTGDPSQTIDQSVAASPGEELHLDLETGAGVTISAWDEPRVEVRGRLGGRDWRDSRVEVRRTPEGVLVRSWSARRSGSQSTSHRLSIRVPKRFDVHLESSGGDLAIDGVEGTFHGSTGGGDMLLTRLRGHADLSTGGGTIDASDSTLSGSVSTGGGGVRLSRISGGLRGHSGSGPVVYREPEDGSDTTGVLTNLPDLGNLRDRKVNRHGMPIPPADGETDSGGALHVSRAGGDVRLAEAPRGAVISTGGGDVVVGRATGLVDATTGGGDIEIGPVAGSVRAGTGAGRVEVTLVDAGGQEQTVEIHSGNGAVVLVLPAGFDGTFELETAYTERFGRETRIAAPWELRRETTGWDSSHGTPRRYVRASGAAGSGRGGLVRVKTVNGDIEVRRGG